MAPHVVICHTTEDPAARLADALLGARIVGSAETSIGFRRANELATQPGKVDAFLIDSALIEKCLERGTRIQAGRNGAPRRIVLAPHVPNSLIIQTAQAGLDDVVDMSTPAEVLLTTLRDSLSGKRSVLSHPIWRSIASPRDVHTIASPYRDTIDREIVSMIAAGLTDEEISHGVYLSCQTVRNRISRMLERSGARNRTHLASIHIHDQYNSLDHVLPAAQPAALGAG